MDEFVKDAARIIARSGELRAEVLQLDDALEELYTKQYTKQGETFFTKDGAAMTFAQGIEIKHAHDSVEITCRSLRFLNRCLLDVPLLEEL